MDLVAHGLEGFADAISMHGFFVSDSLIDDDYRRELWAEAQKLYEQQAFHPARIGKGLRKQVVNQVRGDHIHWIEAWEHAPLLKAKEVFDEIQLLCRQQLFLPIKRYESHFAIYPAESFYKKHVDQHRLNPSRILSCVLYLGEWHPGAGGELVLHLSKGEPSLKIEPLPGRLVLFESKILHEVLFTKVPRWSFTTWFRDDLHPNLSIT